MQNIDSTTALKSRIQFLETEKSVSGQLLKDQLYFTYESLRPANLVKSALHDISTSPFLIDNILSTSMGIFSGFLTNKLVVGRSGSIIRSFLGTILQFGVTNVIAQHPATFKSLGQIIMQYLLRKKRTNTQKL